MLSWGEGNVVVRFLRLWAVGLAVHFAAWTIAYFLVPEGALRGVFLSSRLPLGESSWTAVAGRIVLYNVGVAAGLVAVANLFRVGRFPLGYAAVLAHWALYGLFLGSDSFAYPRGGKLVPQVAGFFTRIGVWEITAYTLLAAATTGLFLYRQASWTDWSTARVRSASEWRLSAGEWLAVAVSLLLIVAAGLREGVAIWGLGG